MGPFYNWLKETEVWMHGADYDMSLFQNAWETLPAMIWDTQTARACWASASSGWQPWWNTSTASP